MISVNLIFVLIKLTAITSVLCLPIDENSNKMQHNLDSNDHEHNQFFVNNCDDTINGIGIDWDGNDTVINEKHYVCKPENVKVRNKFYKNKNVSNEFCRTSKMGTHLCLDNKITYNESIPLGGPHRPVWVTYGDYLYMPPQRWIHAIEHGAAVFLYNPCNHEKEVDYFKSIARDCLRRHIITPSINVPVNQFIIVTHGCRLTLKELYGQEKTIISYLKRHAIKEAPEFHIVEDGNYNFGLIQKAEIVSDFKDSKICVKLIKKYS